IPASVLERDVLPTRVEGYRPAMLDELCAAGELVWIGAGALGADDGRVRLFFRDRVRLLASSVVPPEPPSGPLHDTIREHLVRAGASFWPDLVAAAGTADEAVLLTALWDLVWAGEVTNDTFGPLRVPRRAGARGRLRAHRAPIADEPARVVVLAATDPAQPYGAALSWPEHAGGGRPMRTAGAHVVLIDGECVSYIERGGRALLTFGVDLDDDDRSGAWADALVEAHKEGRLGRLQVERIDDEPARTSPHAPRLRAAGFADGYK